MFNQLKTIYSGKKVFITGHTGFKGSWLLKILSLLGAEIKGYALRPEQELNLYNIIKGDDLCTSDINDLRDRASLKKSVSDFKPDFVFHLAAQPLVRRSYEIPSETFEVNAIGTANLLDAIKLLDKPVNTILITTDKVYYNNEWPYPYREVDRLGGYDPYSASKACTELVVDSYRNSFFNVSNYESHKKAVAVGRAGNVIGGGDWSKDRLMPDIVKALSNNKAIEIRNPDAVRPWQHVLEPLLGYLLLGSSLSSQPLLFSKAYNFGPNADDALPVIEMVKIAIACWGNGDYYLTKSTNQPHEAGLLKLDISKAKFELNWTPKLGANMAVANTISWYKEFFNHSDMTRYTDKQILDFLNG
jgi:CDP-glucose 4,6-dehydratase